MSEQEFDPQYSELRQMATDLGYFLKWKRIGDETSGGDYYEYDYLEFYDVNGKMVEFPGVEWDECLSEEHFWGNNADAVRATWLQWREARK